MLEVFNNLFMSIAEQMGVTLQNTAYSVNIKERLDFSCAVFDRTGALVANAPHMPVHLGSMDRSVETIIRLNEGDMHPGDVFALNAPYNGGTHLPDITVVTPVFSDDESEEILFFTASRGHHADVGGTAPGSMTPLATVVDEEGVLIDNFRLVERGTVPRGGAAGDPDRPPLPRPQPAPEHCRPQGADRRQREGRGGAAQDGRRISGWTVAGLYGPCAGQRRRKRAPRAGAAAGQLRIRIPDRHRPGHQGEDQRSTAQKREATVDFTGTSPVHEEQFQRAGAGRARGRALRVPRHGRKQHPDECRLPTADQHRYSRGLHAAAVLSGRRGGRQCRDLAARHQRDLRRDGCYWPTRKAR
jgi:5-oxoprolinase (ATP-hydrolysing)